MNSFYPNGGPVGNDNDSTPLGDDRMGVRHLYPDSTTERDIAASALFHTPSNSSRTWGSGNGRVALDTTTVNTTEVRLARAEQENGLTPSI